jgi:hypothetical protein
MVIKASASTEIRTLVDALEGDDDVHREAAIARLGIIGARAVDRLTEAYAKTTDRRAHLAILRVLEAIADHRSALLARQALAEGGDVGIAATGVLRALLTSAHVGTATAALDALVATTLEGGGDRRLRLAAFDALRELPPDVRQRVAAAMRSDPGSSLHDVAGVMTMAEGEAARVEAVWNDAVEGRLPDEPDELREALTQQGASAPPNTLRALIDAVRVREREGSEHARHGWLALRGSLHQVLALRGSRLALYDLRESLGAPSARLPVSFLAALHVLGDVSCLEPLAAAWGAAERDGTESGRWRHQLAQAFRAIVQRERITKRHAVMKRIAARWPGMLE